MKDRLYRTALGLYFRLERVPLLSTLNILGYRLLAQASSPASRPCRFDPALKPDPPEKTVQILSELRMVMIADQMTFDCFSSVCHVTPLTCHDWQKEILEAKPHVFFCESAWLGNDRDGHCWRGQIYTNKTFFTENRKTVLAILAYCQANGIPTVFYNKEDPTSFDDPYHNFVDLALKFDCIFTTAAECVPQYLARGAKFCECMQMGVSLKLYNPLRKPGQTGRGAVFAGSWYAEFAGRCADMEELFHQVQEAGITLTIYDRYYAENNPQKQFPAEYRDCIRPAVPFAKLGETLKQYAYALNINTVTDSSTMFARRVFEVMALGLYVLSNPSEGMRQVFGDNLTFTGEEIPGPDQRRKAVLHNLNYVIANHSYESRLRQLAAGAGIAVQKEKPVILQLDSLSGQEAEKALNEADYLYIGREAEDTLAAAALHFAYLPGDTGLLLTGEEEPFVRLPCAGEGRGLLFDAAEYRKTGHLPRFAVRLAGMPEGEREETV